MGSIVTLGIDLHTWATEAALRAVSAPIEFPRPHRGRRPEPRSAVSPCEDAQRSRVSDLCLLPAPAQGALAADPQTEAVS